MEQNINKAKRRQGKLVALISAAAILLLLGLNLLLAYIGITRTVFVDTTYEGLYTLTDLMKEECSFVDEGLSEEVVITFCSDPDVLVDYDLTRAVYFMALKLQNTFDNVKVRCVNVAYNPTAVAKYKPTSLSEIVSGDVIVSYGDRYRVVSSNNFWVSMGGEIIAFNGEYKMASLIKSVTAVDRPKAYFTVGHGETYYDSSNPDRVGNVEAAYLQDLLTDRGLETKTLNLSEVDKIPDDCVLLIINNPTSDFTADGEKFDQFGYVSETEKVDRYLVDNKGSVMVAKDYALTLPNLEDFLYEWGFEFSTSLVKDETAYVEDEDNSYTTILGAYDTDENSYGYAIYGDLASLSSAPSMLFTNSGYVNCSYGEGAASGTNEPGTFSVSKNYAPFFYTSPDAASYEKSETGYNLLENAGVMDLCAVTTRMEIDSYTGEYKYSYLFCANSAEFFGNESLGNASFSNYEVMSALAENMIRSDEYASIDLGSTSANSVNQGGKLLLDTAMTATDYYENNVFVHKGLTGKAITAFTVIIMLVPAAIGALGIVVRVKRRFL